MKHHIYLWTLALATLLMLAGCAAPDSEESDWPPEHAADTQNVVDANNQFAFDLYEQLKGEEGNVFFSPYSISTALAMVYEGARGETATQISRVFQHFWPCLPAVHQE